LSADTEHFFTEKTRNPEQLASVQRKALSAEILYENLPWKLVKEMKF